MEPKRLRDEVYILDECCPDTEVKSLSGSKITTVKLSGTYRGLDDKRIAVDGWYSVTGLSVEYLVNFCSSCGKKLD